MNRIHLSLILASLLSFTAASLAQPIANSPQPKARFTVEKVARAETGELVISVRIFAEGGPLILQGAPVPGQDASEADGPPPAFSLGQSFLVETVTGKKIPALPTLPRKPFFGPLEVITVILKGDWIQMGVAFPFPPAPVGVTPETKSQWLLHLPLDAKPVPITLPTE